MGCSRNASVSASVSDRASVGASVEVVDYGRRYPKMAPKLMKLCGAHIDGTEADYREVAAERLRLVRLDPRDTSAQAD